ncbi:type IV toxin-antitoxin system AbiEi family antitoxin [Actinoplanes sp. CA-142083]|uniref:type IV toxin-antitoxin system AbiEi family antitoxin n=1 Tax=Actinoplanes sp. CA-142083 TaxID=3239903 RepID=UPI003D8AEF63
MQNRTQLGSDGTERLLQPARERLRELGITLEEVSPAPESDRGVDTLVVLSRGGNTAAYSVQVKVPMTLTSVARERSTGPHPLLVVGDRISRRSADAFRDANIQFIDALGNAFIVFGNVYVDVRGRTDSADQADAYSHRSSARQSVNLFSRGRAQVILALLSWPELAGERRREIANAAGTSVGQTHEVLGQLEKAGFLLATSRELDRFDELLDLWTAAYSTGLGPRLAVAQFHGDPGRPIKSDRAVFLSGETAEGVDIARPATVTVYLDSFDLKLAAANRWSANPDRVRNVSVRHKFWVSPRPAEEDPATKPRNAPWPLVYADLMATGDARLAEVARTWRADHARPEQS